jgi:2-keto-4-pentenoate hydratase/2-oxohepta-3-ene-1,7-dioic acid hydratase in catechol pathway
MHWQSAYGEPGIRDVAPALAVLPSCDSLYPGDVIMTGTPDGVGPEAQ